MNDLITIDIEDFFEHYKDSWICDEVLKGFNVFLGVNETGLKFLFDFWENAPIKVFSATERE